MGATTLSDLSITAVAPTVPSMATISYSAASNSDAVSLGVTDSSALVSEQGTVDVSANAPSYTQPVQSFDIAQFETFLEAEEDSELAQIQMGRLNHEVSKYQANIQNELNNFNKENARYQMEFQEAVTKENQDLQVAIANANNLAKEYLQEAQQATQIDQFNKSQDQALDLANKAKQMEDDIGSQVQEYGQNLQADTAGYQWLQDQYKKIKEDYDQAFIMAAPKQSQ